MVTSNGSPRKKKDFVTTSTDLETACSTAVQNCNDSKLFEDTPDETKLELVSEAISLTSAQSTPQRDQDADVKETST